VADAMCRAMHHAMSVSVFAVTHAGCCFFARPWRQSGTVCPLDAGILLKSRKPRNL
jgi:hypothetical protein